ncbi:hypothetical protein [Subtercola endophyticus]|uniref:hypothetical protein n=1 Tax=Subtercola endophyticus TaxID=2895559 RepID=UPI001E455F74|nr:hypothetical protein [Subtercola endophyticus]UFS60605.1 hypothetical protein LQ955_07655 [Subtercola endophyticus]
MTATVWPVESLRALPLLAQNLRRHYEHILLFTDQMLVVVPKVGPVLVSDKCGRMRLDIVGESQAEIVKKIDGLEKALRSRLPGVRLRIEWDRSSTIPVPFR